MLMAIVGDILGSSIEFEHDKPSLAELSIPALADVGRVTDDTVMTLATWKWWTDFRSGRAKVEEYVEYLRSYFHLTPGIGYGPKFFRFMRDGIIPDPPSCGNGAAMRISALGVDLGMPLDEMMDLVERLTLQTHGHPEAVKGAQAVVYSARRLSETRREHDDPDLRRRLKAEIEAMFGYNLDLDYDDLIEDEFDATCQGSVPQAIWCVLSSSNLDDVFRKALTIGGDSDTIACMAGGMAQACFGTDMHGISPRHLATSKLAELRAPEIESAFSHSLSRCDI